MSSVFLYQIFLTKEYRNIQFKMGNLLAWNYRYLEVGVEFSARVYDMVALVPGFGPWYVWSNWWNQIKSSYYEAEFLPFMPQHSCWPN